MSGQPDQTGGTKNRAPQTEAQTTPPIRVAGQGNDDPQAHSQKSNNDPPRWYTPIEGAVEWFWGAAKRHYRQSEWWLVGLALATVGVLLWQTVLNRKAANAAWLNAQSVIDAERPWFVPSIEGPKPDAYEWRVRISNKGRTPGQLRSLSADHMFVKRPDELPLPPQYSGEAILPNSQFFATSDAFTARQWLDEYFNAHDLAQNRNSKYGHECDFLVVYGKATYTDTLTGGRKNEIVHETKWCYLYRDPTLDFVACGPSDYNGYRDYKKGEQKAN
jgi:hypothetical protein